MAFAPLLTIRSIAFLAHLNNKPIEMIAKNEHVTPHSEPEAYVATASNKLQKKHTERHSESRSGKIEACSEMADATTASEFGGAVNKLIMGYYRDVLEQGRNSFRSALAASIVGAIFFIGAIGWTMQSSNKNQVQQSNPTVLLAPSPANISLIAGVLVEVIAGLNFYLYTRTSRQMAAYHICLERTNRFLLANTICNELINDELSKEIQDGTREKLISMKEELVEKILDAPMLTIAQATGTLTKKGE